MARRVRFGEHSDGRTQTILIELLKEYSFLIERLNGQLLNGLDDIVHLSRKLRDRRRLWCWSRRSPPPVAALSTSSWPRRWKREPH